MKRVIFVALLAFSLASCGRFEPADKVEAIAGEDVTDSFKGTYDGPQLSLATHDYATVAVFGKGKLALLRLCTNCTDKPYKPIDVDFFGNLRAVKDPQSTEIKAYTSFSCRALRNDKVDRNYYFKAIQNSDQLTLDEISTRRLLGETLVMNKVERGAALRGAAPATGVRAVDVGCFNEDGRINDKKYKGAQATFANVADFLNEAGAL